MRSRSPAQLGILVGLCCGLWPPNPAFAEQAEPTASLEGQAPPDRLEDIIVTARRRPEPMQSTPVSMTVLSGEELMDRSATHLRSLQFLVPNLTFAPSQNVGEAAGNIFIRGIGQEDFIAAAEPGVGLYVDGIYIAKTAGALASLLDVQRIEVLRGPQGTLYGKNAVGGAINLVSVPPAKHAEARVNVILGDLDRIELRGLINSPLSDQVLLRLAGAIVSRGGYSRRLPPPAMPVSLGPVQTGLDGDDRTQSLALKLRWLASAATLDLVADYTRRRNRQSATHLDTIDPASGEFPRLNQLIRTGVLPGPELNQSLVRNSLFESLATAPGYTRQDVWGIAATLTVERGTNALKLITAYRGMRSRIQTDADGLYFGLIESQFGEDLHQVTGELQLTGRAGPISYSAGLFGLREWVERLPPSGAGFNDVYYLCSCVPGLVPPTSAASQLDTKNIAAYAQADIALSDRLAITLGARYSLEWKGIDAALLGQDADYQPTGPVLANAVDRGRWSSATYRAGFQYGLLPDAMVYASVSKGFKSGGFNARLNPVLPNLGVTSFAPETALTFEAGFRSEWFGRRLRFNATLFQTAYHDIQLRQQTLSGGLLTTLIENAARARIRGIELELAARPFPNLSLTAAYGHIDARYLDVGRVPNITLATPFQRSPRHSFTLSADWIVPIGPIQARLHIDYSHRSHEQFQLTPGPFDQPGYGLLGARMALGPQDRRWSVALFSTNLLGVAYRTAGRGPVSIVGVPRQIGVQAELRFD
jgi:iron complex outermembrane receptor protein